MDWTTIATAVVGSLLGGGGVGGFILARKKQVTDTQATLIDRLEKRLASVEASEQQCQQDRLDLQSKYDRQGMELEALTAVVTRLEMSQLHATVIADSEGKIIHWSPAACKLFGYAKEEAVGQRVTFLTPPKYMRQHVAGFMRALSERKLIDGRVIQAEVRTKDDKQISCMVTYHTWVEGDKWMASAEFRRA